MIIKKMIVRLRMWYLIFVDTMVKDGNMNPRQKRRYPCMTIKNR